MSNQHTHEENISVHSRNLDVVSRAFNFGSEKSDKPSVVLHNTKSEDVTPANSPEDGVFSIPTTPAPRFNGYLHSPRSNRGEAILPLDNQSIKSITGQKDIRFEERCALESPLQNTAIKSSETPLSKSKFDKLPALFMPKMSSKHPDKGRESNLLPLESPDNSLMSANDSIDGKDDGLVDTSPRLLHKEPAGAHIVIDSYQDLLTEFFVCAAVCHQCVVEVEFNGDRNYQGPSPDEIAICKGIRKAGCEFIGSNSQGEAEIDMFGVKKKLEIIMVASL
jgi:hypothetical protein